MLRKLFLFCILLFSFSAVSAELTRHRVIISTDIGGTDPDDLQSMVHLLLYADSLDIEGLISSPFGPGRKKNILSIIDLYEKDYANLSAHSSLYPKPDALRKITKQGETKVAPFKGYRHATEGSQWIIQRARAQDPRPLYVLIWGGLEDLAQALHDAPDIEAKLRVYYIGGPNKKWSPDAYHYIASHFPALWIIEANASYRGWFEGGIQQDEWGNKSFVETHINGQGALGSYFAKILDGTLKMGDSPSVARLLHGKPEEPSQPSWGGQFVRAWTRSHKTFRRLTTKQDKIEAFGIFELILPLGEAKLNKPRAQLHIENQVLEGFFDLEHANVHFRFSPKAARVFDYTIVSDIPALGGKTGSLSAEPIRPNASKKADSNWPNWWTDDPASEHAEGPHIGAKTVNRWRLQFLTDFAQRLNRTQVINSNAARGKAKGRHYIDYPKDWYSSPEARALADNILAYQSAEGAWPKNTDFSVAFTAEIMAQAKADGKVNTIDNNATTLPMRFLALMIQETNSEIYKASFSRGLDYLLAAQYPNGGWPQFFPLRQGYYSRITFNDDAMMNVMFLLREIAENKPLYNFVDNNRRQKSAYAVERGIACILNTQVKQNGRPTGWAAQYDEVTLKPAWARKYEPPSLSGNESVDITRFLMGIEQPTPAQIAAIEGAIAWFNDVAIQGLHYHSGPNAEGIRDAYVVADPNADRLWARFYALETNKPIFLGRDSAVHYSLAEIEQERRGGYAFYGTWPASLLAKDYPKWRKKHKVQD